MDNKINLSQLAERLAQEGGMSKAAAEQFVKNFFDIISQRVLEEGLVKVKGLGTFKLIQMEDRESVNVNTGERFTIDGHQKISFVPDADLKERINKPFAAFDTVQISEDQAKELAKMDAETEQADSAPEDKKPVEEPKKSAKEKRLAQKQAKKAEEARKRAQKQQEKDSEKVVDTPTVKEITQKKGTRFLLKFLIGLLSTVLVIGLILFVMWPVIGNSVLDIVEKNLNKAKTEMVTDSLQNAAPEEVILPEKPAETPVEAPVAKPAETPAETQSAKPAESPAVKPAQPSQQPAAQPAAKPKQTQPQASVKYPAVKLNSQDEAKDLSEFTAADVVNFSIEGLLTTHTLQKGETLTVVALKYYGSKKLWPYIAKYNNISDPEKLQPGIVLRVPVLRAK